MAYLNLDDRYPDHRKIDALSDGAFRLHTSALAYCAREMTDGVVPTQRVNRLMPVYKPSYLRELTSSDLWLPHAEGYEIHDYLDWNKSRAWWEQRRTKETERKAEYRAKRDGQPKGLRSV